MEFFRSWTDKAPTDRQNLEIIYDGSMFRSKPRSFENLPVKSNIISRFYHFCYVRNFFRKHSDEYREGLKKLVSNTRKREPPIKEKTKEVVTNLKENLFMKSNLLVSLENLCDRWEEEYLNYNSEKESLDFLARGKKLDDMILFERERLDEYIRRFYRILNLLQSQSSDKSLCLNYEKIYDDYNKALRVSEKIGIGDSLNLIGRTLTARSQSFRKTKTITPIIDRIKGGGMEKIVTKL